MTTFPRGYWTAKTHAVNTPLRKTLERTAWMPEQPQPIGPARARLINALIERDGNRCYICRRTLGRRQYEIDHVAPRAHGGTDELSNYALACKACNRRKRDYIISIRIADRMVCYSYSDKARCF